MNQLSKFNQEVALELIETESKNPFPVSIEDLITWLGGTANRSAKAHARKVLEEIGFVEGTDFINRTSLCTNPMEQRIEDLEAFDLVNTGGRPATNNLFLSIDAAKHYALMSKRPNGKLIRQIFIDAEKQLRQITSQPATIERSHQGMVTQALAGILENINTQKMLLAQELEKTTIEVTNLTNQVGENKQRLDKASDYARTLTNKVNTIESKANEQQEKLESLIIPDGFATVANYLSDTKAHSYHVPIKHRFVNRVVGTEAKSISQQFGKAIKKVQSAQYTVNCYEIDVIKLAIASVIKQGKLIATKKRVRTHLTLP